MAEHRLVVSPVRQLAWDVELRCERLRGVGYRASCSCGWRGGVRSTVARCRLEHGEHVADLEAGAEQGG